MNVKKVNFEKLFEMLKRIKQICEELDMSWCLTWGSLLGAIREQDFISGSNDDIDIFLINITNDQYDKFLKHFQNDDYRVACGQSNPSYIYHNKVIAGAEIDRIGFSKKGNSNYYFFTHIPIHRSFLDNLKTAKIRDLECPIPDRAEELLELMYGNWKIKDLKSHLSYEAFGIKMAKRMKKRI